MWLHTLFDLVKPGTARRRPPPCRLAVAALDDRCVPASLAVGDAFLFEGNAGTQYAEVRVSLDAPSTRTVTVNYGTANGTALAGSDYQALSGKLTFAPGQTSKSILVPVSGDRLGEPDEALSVKLHGAKNAKIADGTGVVTIVDDEPRLSIRDGVATEGNAGTTLMTFTVTLSAAHDETVTVNYATADGAATIADNDYLAAFGTLTFTPGETSKTITVEVIGDATPEPDEHFYLNLSGASANAWIANAYSFVGILDDDGWMPPGEPCDMPSGGCSTE
jgi:Calx-beta domain